MRSKEALLNIAKSIADSLIQERVYTLSDATREHNLTKEEVNCVIRMISNH